MCVIIIQEPGNTLPADMLENAVYNNPHGYGLILRDPKRKKLEVIRACPDKDKEIDHKEVYDLLKDNEDLERYLHLRWRTQGPIDMDNTHPFTTYFSDREEIHFMHNGTLDSWKPSTGPERYQQGTGMVPIHQPLISDSKRFNDELLQPLFLNLSKADIHNEFIGKVIDKFWGYGSNRGLLVSKTNGFKLINKGDWKEIKVDDKFSFLSSNDNYYKSVVRGPEHERRKKAKEEQERKTPVFANSNKTDKDWDLEKLKDVNFSVKSRIALSESVGKLLNDPEIWTHEGLAELENLTGLELQELVEKYPEDATYLLIHLTEEFASVFHSKKKGERHIERLQKEVKNCKEEEVRVG